jgi:diguanylate cyclase (GGDEF)-like protein
MTSPERKLDNYHRLTSLKFRREHFTNPKTLNSSFVARECLNESSLLIAMAKPDFRLFFANTNFINTFALDSKNLNNKLDDYISSDELNKVKETIKEIGPDNKLIKLNLNIRDRIFGFTAETIFDSNGQVTHYIISGKDITQKLKEDAARKAREEELLANAMIDPLTGLKNRRYFEMEMDRLSKAGHIKGVTVLIADIDKFKTINDTRGHLEGDKILIYLAEIFNSKISSLDTVARFGGDEIVFLLPDLIDKENIPNFFNRFTDAIKLSDHKELSGIELSYGFSIAIKKNHESLDLIMTLAEADKNLYKMKKEKKRRRKNKLNSKNTL